MANIYLTITELHDATEYFVSDEQYALVVQIAKFPYNVTSVSGYMLDGDNEPEELFEVVTEKRLNLMQALEDATYEFQYVHTYDDAREPIENLLTHLSIWAAFH